VGLSESVQLGPMRPSLWSFDCLDISRGTSAVGCCAEAWRLEEKASLSESVEVGPMTPTCGRSPVWMFHVEHQRFDLPPNRAPRPTQKAAVAQRSGGFTWNNSGSMFGRLDRRHGYDSLDVHVEHQRLALAKTPNWGPGLEGLSDDARLVVVRLCGCFTVRALTKKRVCPNPRRSAR
jgi:hypothetical protein